MKRILLAIGVGSLIGLAIAVFACTEETFAQSVTVPSQSVVVGVPSTAVTVTIPSQTVTVLIPPQSVTVTLPAQTVAVTPAPPVVVVPPIVVTGPTAWGYHNGVWSWAGDYSYAAKINYADTVGSPPATDIAVTLTSAWGAWQPFMAANWKYSTVGYTKLTFSLKPTRAGQHWNVFFVGVGDVALPAGCGKDVLKYGPAPVVGQWAAYTVPLADLCVGGGIDVYKFDIQDQTGAAVNTWYVNDVGFTN